MAYIHGHGRYARETYPEARIPVPGPQGPTGAQGPGGGLVAWGVETLPTGAGAYRLAPWNEDIVALAGAFAWSSGCPLVLACLTVRHNVLGAAAENITYTLFINGVATGLAVVLAANAAYATVALPNVPVAPSDLVELRATHAGLTSSPERVVVTATAGSGAFGLDYQRVDSNALFTTGAGMPSPTAFVTKPGATLTTPALTGTYRVRWEALVNNSAANAQNSARLRNITDGLNVGGAQSFSPVTSPVEIEDMSKSALIVFAGAPKQFDVQIAKLTGPNPASVAISFAVIELWRVA